MKTKALHFSAMLLAFAMILSVTGCGEPGSSTEKKSPEILLDGRITLASLIAVTEGHLGSLSQSLAILTKSRAVQSCDWGLMKDQLQKVKEREIPALIWFALPDGSYYSVDKGLTGKNIFDRPYFKKVLKGETVVGELVVSRTTGRKTAIICVPVLWDDKIVGALGASVYLDSLAGKIKTAMALPDNYLFYAMDDSGFTSLNSDISLIFENPMQRNEPELNAAMTRILTENEGYVEYKFAGYNRRVYFSVGKLTGWHFAFGLLEEIK